MYEVLPIPSTNASQWGVFFVFRHLGLPARVELLFRKKTDARKYCKELTEMIPHNLIHRYTWRWIALDDDVNRWWRDHPDYPTVFSRPPYREGGRPVVIDFGNGFELKTHPVHLYPYHHVDWDKQFVVTHITRRTLLEAGWTEGQIVDLTDSDMEAIASRIDDAIRGDDFLEIVDMQAQMVIEWGNKQEGEDHDEESKSVGKDR